MSQLQFEFQINGCCEVNTQITMQLPEIQHPLQLCLPYCLTYFISNDNKLMLSNDNTKSITSLSFIKEETSQSSKNRSMLMYIKNYMKIHKQIPKSEVFCYKKCVTKKIRHVLHIDENIQKNLADI